MLLGDLLHEGRLCVKGMQFATQRTGCSGYTSVRVVSCHVNYGYTLAAWL